jgi:hypothetical protein
LLAAVFDRQLMRLSDRGGASGMIGDRWADICASALGGWAQTTRALASNERNVSVQRIIRLDDVPAIALTASRQKLQNPDFIIIGENGAGPVMLAADAKFSVETAVASQVSAESLQALLQMGPLIGEHLGDVDVEASVEDGVFLCPDYSLTHYMLDRRRLPRRATVDPAQVAFLPVTALSFIEPMEAASLIPLFAGVDELQLDYRRSLLLTLYYFRLVRAGIGCWFDQTGPLLDYREKPALDMQQVDAQARHLATRSNSAWEMIERWDDLAETVRQQRTAVNHVTSLPIVNRELRQQVEAAAQEAGVVAPSLNKVRRRIGAWFRDRLRDDFGPILPPVDDFSGVLMRLSERARDLRPEVAAATEDIILEMLLDAPSIEDATT